MTQLIPCPGCNRHVRQAETSCPFCSAELSLADVPPHVLPRTRLGRAATFAFGATLVGATTLVGCGGESEEGKEGGGGTTAGGTTAKAGNSSGGSSSSAGHPSGGTGITPVYGAPAAGAGNDDTGGKGGAGGTGGSGGSAGKGGGGNFTGGGQAVYGAPAAGAGNTGGSPGVPIYGAAPAD